MLDRLLLLNNLMLMRIKLSSIIILSIV